MPNDKQQDYLHIQNTYGETINTAEIAVLFTIPNPFCDNSP
jgi:hypothetical protein